MSLSTFPTQTTNSPPPLLIFWYINSHTVFSPKTLRYVNSCILGAPTPHFRVYFANQGLLPRDTASYDTMDLLLYNSRDALFCDIVIFSMRCHFQYGKCRVLLIGELGWDIIANRLRKEGMEVSCLSAEEIEGTGATFSPQIIKVQNGGKRVGKSPTNATPQRDLDATDELNFRKFSPVRSPVAVHETPEKQPASSKAVQEQSKPAKLSPPQHKTPQQSSLPSSHHSSPDQQSSPSTTSDSPIDWKKWGHDDSADIEKLRIMMSGKKSMPIDELLEFCCAVYEVPEDVCDKTLRHLLLTTGRVFLVDEANGEIFVSLRDDFDADTGDAYSVRSAEEDPDILKSQLSRNQTQEQLSALKTMFANLVSKEAPEEDAINDTTENDASLVNSTTHSHSQQRTNVTPVTDTTLNITHDHFPTPQLRMLRRDDLPLIQEILQREESHEMALEELQEELEANGINATNLELFLIPYSQFFSVQQTLTSCIVSLYRK